MKKLLLGLAVLAALLMSGCATVGLENPLDTPQLAPASSASTVPQGQKTYGYMIIPFPGLGKDFNPNPTIAYEDYIYVKQLGGYCSEQVDKRFRGRPREMVKQSLLYGVLEGLVGSVAAKWAFGGMISPGQYLKYIGGTAAGGGLASGSITFDEAKTIAKGYCLTMMVYIAQNKHGKMQDIAVIPTYVGEATIPEVSDRPPAKPAEPARKGGGFYLPPPR